MKATLKLARGAIAGSVVMLVASTALAQEDAEDGEVGMALPSATPAKAGAVQVGADHDAMVGRLAVGFLGRRDMLLGNGGIPNLPVGDPGCNSRVVGGQPACVVQAPVIGIRYWIDQMIGIDGGVGFVMTSGSVTTTPGPGQPPVSADEAGITAFIVHAGVPLSLASSGHFSFQLTPELNVGFATRTIRPPPANPPVPDIDLSGFHLDIGLRGGAEVHFGFIDIPQLSLQGSVGVLYETDRFSTEQGPDKAEASHGEFRTSTYGEPWSIFTANVAALYYF